MEKKRRILNLSVISAFSVVNFLIFILYPISLILSFTGCSSKVEEKPKRYVRYTEAKGEVEKQRLYVGYAKPGSETPLSFCIGGTISKTPLLIGNRVKKGDKLAELDPCDYLLKVKQAKSLALDAKALFKGKEVHYERTAGLYETHCVSKSELDKAKTEYESAIAKMQAAKIGVEVAKKDLENACLIAPHDGVIVQKPVVENENVIPGQEVLTLHSEERIKVQIALPEQHVHEIKLGQKAEVVFNALNEPVYEAYVTEVGVANPSTTTFPITLQLEEKNLLVRPGMTANVLFRLSPDTCEPLVPPHAVFEEKGEHFLFVLVKKGDSHLVSKRKIELGEFTNEGILILSGIDIGDKIVTAGISSLSDGEEVELYADETRQSHA